MTDAKPRGTCGVLIRNARILDGSGAPPKSGSVAVEGDRILAVGEADGLRGRQEIDAAGRILAPGIIDVHTHDDNALFALETMVPKLTQGVTTVVTGNCGVSAAPLVLADKAPPPPLDLLGGRERYRFATFAAYLDALDRQPIPVNAVPMVGHSTLRVGAMAEVGVPASAAEIETMRGRVGEAIEAGACGFSTGLFYPTNRAAPMAEVVALLEVLKGSGAVYATHMRDEGDGVEDSLEESFETAHRAGVPLVISHHKCVGQRNFGRSQATLHRIARAQARQPVSFDVYPYTAGSTVLLPDFMERASRVLVTWSEPHPDASGRDLAEIAAEWGCSRAEAIDRLVPAGAIYFMMDEADVRRIMAYRDAMIGSDGLPHDKHPHPRLWGTFPRVLGHYVRELGLMSLEEAVHRMTAVAADTFGVRERGRIAPGHYADLVMFDPATVIDRATFEEPCRPAAGINWVFVNGQAAVADGKVSGTCNGRVLRRAA
jgi:N-acyl-D-amino-acid deacylase